MCCCGEHCEVKLHLPTKVQLEEMPLAKHTEMMSMDIILAMEEEDVPSGEICDLTGLLNSVNLDISAVFRQ